MRHLSEVDSISSIPRNVLSELQDLASHAEAIAQEIKAKGANQNLESLANQALINQGNTLFSGLAEQMVAVGEMYPLAASQAQQTQARQLTENPIFLCGHAKSGTTLLRNLLDGHSQIMLIPVDGKAGYRQMAFQFDKTGQFWSKELRKDVTYYLMNPMGFTPPNWTLGSPGEVEAYIAFNRYQSYWRQQFPQTVDGDLRALICAFYCARTEPGTPPFHYWAEKTPRTYENAQTVAELFPAAKFVHIVRHPAAAFTSFKGKMIRKQKTVDFIYLLRQLRRALDFAKLNVTALGAQRYMVVHFEELLQNPREVMASVADFLHISFEEILVNPTVGAQPANPNTAYLDSTDAPGNLMPDRVELWRKKISQAELEVLEFFLARQMAAHGYARTTNASPLKVIANLFKIQREYRDSSPYLQVGVRNLIHSYLMKLRR